VFDILASRLTLLTNFDNQSYQVNFDNRKNLLMLLGSPVIDN
jgi:hypothetical protein